MIKVYTYAKCSTCKNAISFLNDKGVKHKELPIRETPPSEAELKKMLKAYNGEIRRLFNTSGMDYRAMNLKDKLPSLSEAEAFELLQSNGNLVKRPFLIGDGKHIVGFKAADWEKML